MRYDNKHSALRILLADDDEDDRMFFVDAIKEGKLQTSVETVGDGKELMDLLNIRSDGTLPHVIFLDLNMPRKNGFECLQEIRSNNKFREIAIVIYSTSISESDIHETFVKGANIYLKKPNSFIALKQAISRILSINWQYHTSSLNRENFVMII